MKRRQDENPVFYYAVVGNARIFFRDKGKEVKFFRNKIRLRLASTLERP